MVKFLVDDNFNVKSPEREFGNAGVDFFIPYYNSYFESAFEAKNPAHKAYLDLDIHTGEHYLVIAPHGDANIPSGVRSRLSANIALEAQNKSGVAAKYKLVYGASTVDANYQGIIHCHVINTTGSEVRIPLGSKIVQFIPRFIDISPIEVYRSSETTYDEFYKNFEFSNRRDGAFGSTGTK